MIEVHHLNNSRSQRVLWMLEELGIDYRMELVDIRGDKGAPEDYRRIQPNKKVPAIDHDGVVVTERGAISIYLGDAFPQAGLAPKIGEKDRAAYLTWLVYCDAVFDPAVAARAQGWKYESNSFSFGSFEDMVANVEKRLNTSKFAAGERFTAADVMLAGNIAYVMQQKWLPERPAFIDYLARTTERPAAKRAQAKDMEMAKAVPAFAGMFKQG